MCNTSRKPVSRQFSAARPRTPQRGIAIVTVLLVVALAATLAASVVWRELVAVRDVENQRLNVQTMWVERAAVEWARATLRAQSSTSNVAYVGQAWSAPVQDVQLVDFLPRDTVALNGELAHAYISGEVEDAQAKFNLTDLVSRAGPNAPWQIDSAGIEAYRRLLGALALNPALAEATASYMLRSLGNGNGAGDGWPMQLVSPQDLARVPGYDAATVKALTGYVTVLPEYTNVNANTASEPALQAAIPTLSASQAHMLVERRQTAYFVSASDIALLLSAVLTNGALPSGTLVSTNSGYFLVHCRIHSAKVNLRMDTLIARYGIGDFSWTAVVWAHRVAG
ncbi:general secretion pathway protein K [Paraburkholderia sp. GAS38]|jgi:general secretion pathway protein K|uniref:type II secretion system minor pseudopilin GspK n=1 Tax=Paraburkholderia sp. GAS38 TaxID=3035133 RepID=UPI003D191CD3